MSSVAQRLREGAGAVGRRPRRQVVGDVLLVVVPPAGFLVASLVYNNQLLLLTMMVYVALAQGLNVIFGFTGYLPFGHAGFLGAGAHGAALSTNLLHVPIVATALLGDVAGATVVSSSPRPP